MLDFPIAPPISIKAMPKPRRLECINDARAFVDEALAERRAAPWREMQVRLDGIKTPEEAIDAAAALRELLMIEGLLASSAASRKRSPIARRR
jgi:hypothetical protein